MPNRPLVIDIYRGDVVTDFSQTKASGIVACYHKASEGVGWTDDSYERRRKLWMNGEQATVDGHKLDVAWGAYHFFHGGDPVGEAKHFLVVAQLQPQDLAVIDWEPLSGGGFGSSDEVIAFIEEVEQITARPCAIYSGSVAKEAIHGHNPFFAQRPLILAQYGSRWTVQESWARPWLWQDNGDQFGPGPHRIPGLRGLCDNNTIINEAGLPWIDAAAQFLRAWTGVEHPVPVPQPPVPPPPPPQPITARRFSVIATEFGGTGDLEQSAYPPYRSVDPDKPGFALPFHFQSPLPQVDVFLGDKMVTCECVDVGPRFTNDPYWRDGASGQPRYHAGIDLTPAVWDALGIGQADDRRGMTQVEWAFRVPQNARGLVYNA